jgi:CHAD domain-containing protein
VVKESISDEDVEMELKLVLRGPEDEAAVIACLRGNNYTVEEIEPVLHVDTYLDTFDWILFKNKTSLRYRVSNGRASYALKNNLPIEEGSPKRLNLEGPLDGPADIPAVIPVKRIRKLVEGMIFPRKLLEHVQVRTHRRVHRVRSPNGAEIELAFDTSSFSLRGLHKPRPVRKLYELEAEILKGPPTALDDLWSLLSSRFGHPASEVPKLDIVIERFKIAIPSKKMPEKLRVRREDRLDFAIRKILTFQLQRLREQIPGIKRDIDTEFVHQARVSARRMRSCVRYFRDALPESVAAYFTGELKWMGGCLGAVRDLDVFLLNLSRFRQQIARLPGKKRQALEDWIERRRREPLTSLREAVESARYRSFERRLIQFLERPLPLRPRQPLAGKTVDEVAPVLIIEKFDAVIKQGAAVMADPKLKEFHRLRIQMKRLRYACEFMAPAYDGALDPFVERTVEIQDCLGELQDTVFTRNFVDSLCSDWEGKLVDPDLLFILGEIYQLQAGIARERQQTFGKIWERFSSEETATLLKDILQVSSPPVP